MKIYYVYVLELSSNGEVFYVGKGIKNRYKEHRKRAVNDKRNYYVYNKINSLWKQGLDYTERIIFRTYDENLAYEREKDYIKMFGKENLCNLTDGGDGSGFVSHSEETKKKIGDKNRGRKHTPETIQLMREVHTGCKLSDAEKQRQKDLIWADNKRLEHLRSQAMLQAKKVKRLDTGEIFNSIADIANNLGVSATTIRQAIKRNYNCKGTKLMFVS